MINTIELPFVYGNWLLHKQSVPFETVQEFVLYTDAGIVGEIREGLGPYALLNGLDFRYDNSLRAGIILRAEIPKWEVPSMLHTLQTDTDGYHAGGLVDEMAALLSLSLGIRVKAGHMTRIFHAGGDPKGSPYGNSTSVFPALLRRHEGERFIIPTAIGGHSLNAMTLLPQLSLLRPVDARALVVAARSYQNAIWIAESEPELSWLLFVSAIETAAVHWSKGDDSPRERIKAWKPELYDALINAGGDEHLEYVAKIVAPVAGATNKFFRFIKHYFPEPPSQRPPEWIQVKWSKTSYTKILDKIYTYRSEALHTGKPFPAPMCEPPSMQNNETIIGEGVSSLGATWQKEDVPILLHVFEYLTRNVLLKWWEEMTPRSTSEDTEKRVSK